MKFAPDGRLFYTLRHGELRLFKEDSAEDLLVAKLPVYHDPESKKSKEDGLLGLAFDPNFQDNQHIWLFYAPLTVLLSSKRAQNIDSWFY